jgi:hypothetical protein
MKLHLVVLAALLLPASALGQTRQFKNGEAVTLEPDKAYFLARTYEFKGGALRGTIQVAPVLARLLTDEEMREAAELRETDPDHWKEKAPPNVVEMLPGEPYARANGESVLLTATRPGTYILVGVALTNWVSTDAGQLVTSLCLGTVKFEAKPGVITDLGEVLAARDDIPTTIPELASIVTQKSFGFGVFPYDVAIRPVNSSTLLPASLAALPRIPADYGAMPAYPNYSGANLNRLAPLAGVLDYDKDGGVIDLKAKP